MASGSVWGLDIGKSSLKAVRLRRGKDELEVQALYHQEYAIGADGTIAPSEPTSALEALIAKYPAIKAEPVHVALPGHKSFSRFIKLPAFDERKLAEMARFEAQQQIPFPIADVNWDYSLIEREYEPDEDREVGLFAIKKELVVENIADLQLCGIEPASITTTPLAIYNFVTYDLELPEDEATIVLDIGWSTTDLVIIDGARYWIRNLALNGHELTKAISAKLKIQFDEAEQQKRDAAQAKEPRKLYQATELVLKDFTQEIQRSIAFYKAQNKDRTIKIGQVLLLGNGAKLQNVRPFFQKELGLPVETVKRLTRLTLDMDVEPDEVELLKEHLPTFGVAFGLAIQGAGEAINAINLLPTEIRQRQALEKKKPLVAAAVALMWVAVIVAWILGRKSEEQVAEVLKRAKKNLSDLQANQAEIETAKAPIADLEKQVASLVAHTQHRARAIEVLNKLVPLLPKGNDAIVQATPQQKKDLQFARAVNKIEQVRKDLQAAQDKLNQDKTWILEIDIKPEKVGSEEVLRTTVFCARNYVRNASGAPDELATQKAVELGLLADLKSEFKNARFEGAPKKLYGLDKDAAPPPGAVGGFGGTNIQVFCGLGITFSYPAVEPKAAPAAGEGAEAGSAANETSMNVEGR